MKKTYAVIGYGNRGSIYAQELKKNGASITAICDISERNLHLAKEEFGEAVEYFLNPEIFYQQKRADILIIATMDQAHFHDTITALELGYDLLLEKPLSPWIEESRKMTEVALKLKRKVLVCHVLRYTKFYSKLQEIIAEGKIGKVVNIFQAENINLGHYVSSFVRGNWANSEKSSSIILQKTCHDLDIIYWLMGKKCVSVSSFGSLYYFNEKNAPVGAAKHCYNCPLREKCIYDAIKMYTKYPDALYQYDFERTEAGVLKLLADENNPHGKCVYRTDNNVMDNQVVNLLFEDGATAQLSLTAFNKVGHRYINIHGTHGDITGDLEEGKITLNIFDAEFGEATPITYNINQLSHGHSGGDQNLIKDLIEFFENDLTNSKLSFIEDTLMSHEMAHAAEVSRINGGTSIKIKGGKDNA